MTYVKVSGRLSLSILICVALLDLLQVTKGNTYGIKSTTDNLTELVINAYDSGVRPVCSGQETVNVTIDLAIRQIIDLDEPSQTVKFSIWMRLGWTDCQLTWDPSDFDGTTSIVLPIDKIWRPDITLYNTISTEFYGFKDYRARIDSNGYVVYNFPTILEAQCALSITKFPFDSQVCSIMFGSWSFHGNEVDINSKKSEADLSSIEENVEWIIEKAPGERHVLYYGCCVEPYPDMTFYIHLTRKPDFYVNNIIVPSLLVTLVACLGFFLPADSGEKIGLELTVMLAMSVFQLLIADHLPPSADDSPWISTFFTMTLVLAGTASSWQVFVLNIHHRGERPMPNWIKGYLLKPLGKVTCIPISRNKDHPKRESGTSVSPGFWVGKFAVKRRKNDCLEQDINQDLEEKGREFPDLNQNTEENGRKFPDFNQNTEERGRTFLDFDQNTEEKDRKLSMQTDNVAMNNSELWIQLALMLDRIGLIVFALSLFIGCLYIMMSIR